MPPEQDPSTTDQTQPAETTPDFAQMANAAASAHTKRLEKSIPSMIQATVATAIAEALKGFQPAPTQSDDDGGKPKKLSPEVAALQQQIADMKAASDRAAAAHEAQIKRARDERAVVDLKQSLAGSVKKEFVDILAGHLFSNGAVDFAEDGAVLFKVKQSNYGIEDEVAMPLGQGLAQWLKSDAAKPFLPAPDTNQAPPVRRQQTSAGLNPFTKNNPPPDFTQMNDAQRVAAAADLEAQLEQMAAQKGR